MLLNNILGYDRDIAKNYTYLELIFENKEAY